MATIGGAYFTKVYEDEFVVRYGFSDEPPDVRRTLTVSKADNRITPDDGNVDREFRAAAMGVNRDLRRTGEFPQSGQWVSH
ncbi:MAG TPA: hypothetical protein VGD67_29350 [Pseudonocardiaceae bacterium]